MRNERYGLSSSLPVHPYPKSNQAPSGALQRSRHTPALARSAALIPRCRCPPPRPPPPAATACAAGGRLGRLGLEPPLPREPAGTSPLLPEALALCLFLSGPVESGGKGGKSPLRKPSRRPLLAPAGFSRRRPAPARRPSLVPEASGPKLIVEKVSNGKSGSSKGVAPPIPLAHSLSQTPTCLQAAHGGRLQGRSGPIPCFTSMISVAPSAGAGRTAPPPTSPPSFSSPTAARPAPPPPCDHFHFFDRFCGDLRPASLKSLSESASLPPH